MGSPFFIVFFNPMYALVLFPKDADGKKLYDSNMFSVTGLYFIFEKDKMVQVLQ